jgi:hypothetical protein
MMPCCLLNTLFPGTSPWLIEHPLEVSPPAPRLVGIELNPGPKGRPRIAGRSSTSISSGLSALGSLLGSTLAKKGKKAVKSIAKSHGSRANFMPNVKTVMQTATIARQAAYRSIKETEIFSVPFHSAILQVATNSAGTVVLQQVGLAATGTASVIVSVSPFVTSNVAVAPICFPPQMNRLAQSFSRFRVRPGSGNLSFRTAVPTSTAGSLAIAALPSEYPLTASPSYQTIAGCESAIVCPAWTADMSFDKKTLSSVTTTGPEWKYCDYDGVITQPEFRQDSIFNMAVQGLALPASTVFGLIFYSGVLEFQHLQDNLTLTGLTRAPIDIGDQSSSSVSLPSTAAPMSAASSSSESSRLGGPLLVVAEDYDPVCVCSKHTQPLSL